MARDADHVVTKGQIVIQGVGNLPMLESSQTVGPEPETMTTIRTTCDRCGDVELTTSDIGLELRPAATAGTYRFECPFCTMVQRRPANSRVVSILLATGVEYEIVDDTGPITEDEIDAFAAALEQDGWYTQITS